MTQFVIGEIQWCKILNLIDRGVSISHISNESWEALGYKSKKSCDVSIRNRLKRARQNGNLTPLVEVSQAPLQPKEPISTLSSRTALGKQSRRVRQEVKDNPKPKHPTTEQIQKKRISELENELRSKEKEVERYKNEILQLENSLASWKRKWKEDCGHKFQGT